MSINMSKNMSTRSSKQPRYASGHRFSARNKQRRTNGNDYGNIIENGNASIKSNGHDNASDNDNSRNNRKTKGSVTTSQNDPTLDQFLEAFPSITTNNGSRVPKVRDNRKKEETYSEYQQNHDDDDDDDNISKLTMGTRVYPNHHHHRPNSGGDRSMYTTQTTGTKGTLYTMGTTGTRLVRKRTRNFKRLSIKLYLLFSIAVGYLLLSLYGTRQTKDWWSSYSTNLHQDQSNIYAKVQDPTFQDPTFLYSLTTNKNRTEEHALLAQQLVRRGFDALGDNTNEDFEDEDEEVRDSDPGLRGSKMTGKTTATNAKTGADSAWHMTRQMQKNNSPLPRYPNTIFNCEGMHQFSTFFFPNFQGKIVRLQWAGMPWDTSKTKEEKEMIKLENAKLLNETATKDDLFVSNLLRADVCLPDSFHDFPGKQLYHNIEAWDYSSEVPQVREDSKQLTGSETDSLRFNFLPPSDKIFVVGPHKDTKTSIQVSYMQLLLPFYGQEQRDKIFRHEKKAINSKQHFLLYVHSHYVSFREEAAHELQKIGTIHTNGICEGNYTAGDVSDPKVVKNCQPYFVTDRPSNVKKSRYLDAVDTNFVEGNEALFGHYRFGLVMENFYREGYVTEKILNCFLGGAIPIWYGTRQIFDIFNHRAFIYYDIDNPQKALDRIAYLEANPNEYEKVLKEEPILKDGMATIEKYFSMRDDVGRGHLKNRVMNMIGFNTAP